MSIILQYKLPPLETKTNGKKKRNKKNIYTSPKVYNVLIFKTGKGNLLWKKLIPDFSLFQTDCTC